MFTFRKLTIMDLKSLLSLSEEVYEKMPRQEFWGGLSKDDYLHLLTKPNFILGAFKDSTLAAFMCSYNPNEHDLIHYGLDNYKLDEISFIHGVMVKDEFRGNKLQFKLLTEIEKMVNKKYLFATVHPENIHSQRNFTDFGFKIIATKNLSYGYRNLMIKKAF